MKAATPFVSTSILLIAMSCVCVILFPLFMKNPKQRIIEMIKKRPFLIILATIFNTAAMYLYVLALRTGDVSKVTGIYQGMMIVSIVMGIILLKEKQDVIRKLIGAVITVGGVLLLTIK